MAGGKRMRPEDVRAIHEYIKANPDASIEEVAYSCHRSATTVRAVKRGAYADLYDPKREALRGLSEPEQLQIGADLDELRERLGVVEMAAGFLARVIETMEADAEKLQQVADGLRYDAHSMRNAVADCMESCEAVRSCLGL